MLQFSKDGSKKLDVYGILRKDRDILPVEVSAFNDLKRLVEVNINQPNTTEIKQKVKDSLFVTLDILSSNETTFVDKVRQCSFLKFVSIECIFKSKCYKKLLK